MRTLLIYRSGSSNKFWQIAVAEKSFAVTYGKIGSAGKVNVKEFPSAEACEKEANRLIQSKLKKGYQPAETAQPEIQESTMTESSFWQLIVDSKYYGEDSLEHLEWLVFRLAEKSVLDILIFDSILKEHYRRSYTSDLWAAAIIAMGNCSDDCFDYFRAWLFYLGKEVYYEAIEAPESLVPYFELLKEQDKVPLLEELLTAASDAYEEKTGHDSKKYMELYDQLMKDDDCEYEPDFDWEKEDEESLRKKFPILWEAFGEDPLSL